jgi:glucoamylase
LHWVVRRTRATLALGVAATAAALAISGGSGADPEIPRGFPGVRPAFLGGGVAGQGGAAAAFRSDRRWLARSKPLGAEAPGWASRMYARSLLVLRALTDRRSGAVAAGAREGWAYVWPRDAGAVAIALAAGGYRDEARRVALFLRRLDLDAAARFRSDGGPIEGRAAQGDALGWARVAASAAAAPSGTESSTEGGQADRAAWSGHADYQEKEGGDYLANAIASGVGSLRIREAFVIRRGLVRRGDDPASGLDSAAAWAVRPFPHPALFPAVRRTLLRLAAGSGRFGLLPSENWDGGEDPWTAPTAWSAWSLAALARQDRRAGFAAVASRERGAALGLVAALRRAATPLGLLPERVDAETGFPASTTPLAWSHAFAVLALRELWPGGEPRSPRGRH